MEGYADFLMGLKVAFSLYFLLNLVYPKKFETTLEFIQRYFLKIHPDQGNKTKKATASRKKVFTLMNNLKKKT